MSKTATQSKTASKSRPNYITPAGAVRLQAELKSLLYTLRPEMVNTVAWAASNGDRSENGDYIYGKRRLREIDRRIHFITQRMDAAVVVDPVQQHQVAQGRVLFGCTVTVENEEGQEKSYSIVGEDEIDLPRGRLSWISPIAKALLGHREGDEISFGTPGGMQELEIVRVEYRELD